MELELEFDRQSQRILNELRVAFDVGTDAEVIRRALALARVAVRNADADGSITLVQRDGGLDLLQKSGEFS